MAFKTWHELSTENNRKLALLQAKKHERDIAPALSLDQYAQYFSFGGLQYPFIPTQTLLGNREDIPASFAGYVQGAYRSNGVVFACVLARMMVFSEIRFQWQRLSDQGDGSPSDLWGDTRLSILETPEPNRVTGDLLTRMMQDADIGGNFYGIRHQPADLRLKPRIKRLRPDWVTIILGSDQDPPYGPYREVAAGDIDAEVIGYMYKPGGYQSKIEPVFIPVDQMCHYAPIPDPLASYRGMSWLTPVLREIMGDSAMTAHKLSFMEKGATVNMIVSLDPDMQEDAFNHWVDIFRTQHEGVLNAYRTLFIAGGATVTPVGNTFQQMDFAVVQSHGEARIASAAGVPPIIAGLTAGLEASTYSNYQQARRHLADITIRPLWRNACASLQAIVPPPGMSRLWYDERNVAFLREDRKDLADIMAVEASAISTLVQAGYEPDSCVAAVRSNDFSKLVHSGMYSVQLQPPGTNISATQKALAPPKSGASSVPLLTHHLNAPQPPTPAPGRKPKAKPDPQITPPPISVGK